MRRKIARSPLFAWTASILRPLFDRHVYRVRRGLARGMWRKGGWGFLPFNALDKEEQFLSELDLRRCTVYDIGGWEGVYSLFFARAVGSTGKVHVFEPHPDNARRIIENVHLNDFSNVFVHQLALGRRGGQAVLCVPRGLTGRGWLRESCEDCDAQHVCYEVAVASLDEYVNRCRLPMPQFIKVDVEGAELAVLEGMSGVLAAHAPRLFIEVHAATHPEVCSRLPDLLTRLWDRGYDIYLVEQDLRRVNNPAQLSLDDDFHLYCSCGG